jgi:CubicO group peptidase (beta-lactamase class C family)
MDLDKGVEAYLKAKENDVKPNNATFANLLSLTAGFGEQGLFTYMYI